MHHLLLLFLLLVLSLSHRLRFGAFVLGLVLIVGGIVASTADPTGAVVFVIIGFILWGVTLVAWVLAGIWRLVIGDVRDEHFAHPIREDFERSDDQRRGVSGVPKESADVQEAFRVVLNLARENIIPETANRDEHEKQVKACKVIEDLSMKE